jgi:hypothetical protein
MLSQESPSGKDGKYQGLIGTTLGRRQAGATEYREAV